MLKPIEETDELNDIFFVVTDIECYASPHPQEGEVIAIDTCWRENGKVIHEKHSTWSDWWFWLVKKSKEDERFRIVYAHNGGGYDWISFVDYLLHKGSTQRKSLSAACVGSKMITLSVMIEKSHTIRLCDSLQLLRSKLDDLAKVFTGKRKVDTGGLLPHELFHSDMAKFTEYHNEDTELLLSIMEKALFLMRSKVAKIDSFGMTIGSTAMKVFRVMGLKRELTIPDDPGLKEFLRQGYRGGRVECFKPGTYSNVSVFDINSLYPFAMKMAKVPVSDRGVWTRDYEKDKVGVFEIEFRQKRKDIFPILMEQGVGVYEGKGVYFTPEIDLICQLDPQCQLKIISGFEFLENDFIFADYVDKLYSLRLEFPDSAVSILAKFLLNSLYGKFGQHSERESIVSDSEISLERGEDESESDYDERLLSLRIVNKRLGVCGITRQSHCGFEHVGIAGMITSLARVQLFKGLLNSGMENVIYCDTDSVHTMGTLPAEMVGIELGKYKREFSGEGSYAGKKLYALRGNEGKKTCKKCSGKGNVAGIKCECTEKVRVKGVSVGGKFGTKIRFQDIAEIVAGNSLECLFKQFSTPLEVISERAKPGVLQTRKRTIRRLVK